MVVVRLVSAVTIWEVGRYSGLVPEKNQSDITPRSFYESQQYLPFVVRGFHPSLNQMAAEYGFQGDPVEWMMRNIDGDSRMTSLEGELQETRLAPTIHKLKFKYFFEKFGDIDAYAVTQAPESFRRYLQLFPIFSCEGMTVEMQPPMMWISGGKKKSKSVIHDDSNHNQHCVLKGSKRFMIIPSRVPIETPDYGWVTVENDDGTKKEGFEDAYGEFVGLVDYNNVDLEAFPKWRDVPWFMADLKEGDCLYMPIGWYHYVESEAEPTVTWHQWFRTPRAWPSGCEGENWKTVFLDQCSFKLDDQIPRSVNTPAWSDDRISTCAARRNTD